jgi:rod shape-determining protein MreC
VQLITDSASSVAAKIQGSRAEGIVEGSVSGTLTMDFVDRDIVVDPKLVVVTSGFGGIYPPAIPIGIVADVSEEDVNIYKEIEIQAFVDFRVLEEVMVLILPEG